MATPPPPNTPTLGAYGKEEWDQFVALVGDPSASIAAWGPKAVDDELESRGWKGSKAGRVQAYYKTLQQGQTQTQTRAKTSTERAFEVGFVDSTEIVNLFANKVKSTISEWSNAPDDYHGPYFAVCQSSGYGKSRLVTEVAKAIFFSCYISLAPKDSSAYPSRTARFADNLMYHGNVETHRDACLKYICTCLTQLSQHLSTSTSPPTASTWWEYLRAASGEVEPMTLPAVLASIKQSCNRWGIENQPLVFTYDEARTLISDPEALGFRGVRYTLQTVAKAMKAANLPLNVCGIFMDTTSHVANFAAVTTEDPSARSANVFKKSFHPFFIFPTVDVFTTSVLCLGRPLWGADQVSTKDTEIDFAGLKLMGGVGAWDNCDKENTAIALLSSRLSLRVSPQSQMAKKLVSTHMGTLVGISPDRNHIYVDYPSEPILAEAAARLMKNPLIYRECLRTLQHLASVHVVEDVGEMGELVARIILTRCFDVCVCNKSTSAVFAETPIKVKDFLETLLAKSDMQFATAFQALSEGEVAYTHFARVKRFPTLTDLKHAFERRVAFQLWHNAKSIDIIIPVKLQDGTFRAIVIQVKNTTDTLHYYSLLKAAAVVAKGILKSDRTDRSEISVSNSLPSTKRRRANSANTSLDSSYEIKPEEEDDDDDDCDDVVFKIEPTNEDINDDTLDSPAKTTTTTTSGSPAATVDAAPTDPDAPATLTDEDVVGADITADVDPSRSHIVIVIAFQKVPSMTICTVTSRDTQAIGITILGARFFNHLTPNNYSDWIADLERMLRGASIYVDLEEDAKRALQRVMGISELDTYVPPNLGT